MRYALLAFALLAIPARSECGPITYNLRDARFFGGAPGPARDLNDSGSFTPATSEILATTSSTGGANPVEFTGTARTQGSPLELRATTPSRRSRQRRCSSTRRRSTRRTS